MKTPIKKLSVICLTFLGFGLSELTGAENNPPKVTGTKFVMQNQEKGKELYVKLCSSCHQLTGAGIPGAFPPLAASDYLNKDVNRSIKTIITGLTGEVVVNGAKYNSAMPAQAALSDQDIADVLTYVYASWGNNKKKVTPAMVKAQRK